MNILSTAKRATIIKALTEGASIRSTARLVGVSKSTVLNLLVEVGEFCSIYQDHKLRHLACKRIEADEIWAFVGAKQRNATRKGDGDIWTHTAMCAETRLMFAWHVGGRSRDNVHAFMHDVADRLANRVQVSTDGNTFFLSAVEEAFGFQSVDYAQVVKHFSSTRGSTGYSPPICTGATRHQILGRPDMAKVSTSYIERSNLHLRMSSKRFARLSNAFSRKVENHAAAVSLHFMTYNFCRAHGTLTKAANGVNTTPAMKAGLTDHVWTVEEILSLMDPKAVTIK